MIMVICAGFRPLLLPLWALCGWLLAVQPAVSPCANVSTTMAAMTLEKCKTLQVKTAVYDSTALCPEELQHWSMVNFTRAERALFGGMTKAEYVRSLAATDWSAARAEAMADRQTFFQKRLGASLGQVYRCTDGSSK
eukprot:COSAG01_NODE_7435_length_3212_cov_44.278768_2_plen_136_part_01